MLYQVVLNRFLWTLITLGLAYISFALSMFLYTQVGAGGVLVVECTCIAVVVGMTIVSRVANVSGGASRLAVSLAIALVLQWFALVGRFMDIGSLI